MKLVILAAPAIMLALAACAPAAKTEPVAVVAASPTLTAPAAPAAVDGWREYPLREGVIKVQPATWTTDKVDIMVFGSGGELEYKLGMKRGDTIVYSIDYPKLEKAELMVSEFHGHTPQGADGNGDLMYYSKSNGTAQSGSFTAPWDGIHGWYLKNTSDKDVTVKLRVAGFYEKLK